MKRMAGVLALVLGAALILSSPVAAHHKAKHTKGKGQAKTAKDGTGTPDAGDNKHPSGKDKSVEPGGSGTQGNSSSDPDDDGHGPDRSNGGADKPGGPGGVDLDDQDGNNGCGNDDDFEDDNEGWCGKNPKRGGPKAEAAKDDAEKTGDETLAGAFGSGGSSDGGDLTDAGREVAETVVVLSDVLVADSIERTGSLVEDEVLGNRITKAPLGQAAGGSALRGRAMPFTGSDLISFVALGIAVLGLGYALTRLGRKSSF